MCVRMYIIHIYKRITENQICGRGASHFFLRVYVFFFIVLINALRKNKFGGEVRVNFKDMRSLSNTEFIKLIENNVRVLRTNSDGELENMMPQEIVDALPNQLGRNIVFWLEDALLEGMSVHSNDILFSNGDYLSDYFDGEVVVNIALDSGRLEFTIEESNLWEWVEFPPVELLDYVDEAQKQANSFLASVLRDNNVSYDTLGHQIINMVSPKIPTFTDWDYIVIEKNGDIAIAEDNGEIKYL